MKHFMEHWHTFITVGAVLIVGGFILVREVRHVFLRIKGEKIEQEPNAFLIGAISILIVTLSLRVEQVSHRVTEDLEGLRLASDRDNLEHFRTLRKRLDPNLAKVHGEQVDRHLNYVLRAIDSGQVVVTDIQDVSLLYKKMLPRFEGAEFWSTSVPTRQYFWGDRSILVAMKDFIQKHDGKMTRIFFLKGNEPDPEALEIMREQAAVKVDVYYVPAAALPTNLNQFYFVSANQRIAWRVTIDQFGKVTEVMTTIRREDVEAYRDNFRRIQQLPATRKFELAAE